MTSSLTACRFRRTSSLTACRFMKTSSLTACGFMRITSGQGLRRFMFLFFSPGLGSLWFCSCSGLWSRWTLMWYIFTPLRYVQTMLILMEVFVPDLSKKVFGGFFVIRYIPLWLGLWGWASARRSVGSEEWLLRSLLRWIQCPAWEPFASGFRCFCCSGLTLLCVYFRCWCLSRWFRLSVHSLWPVWSAL